MRRRTLASGLALLALPRLARAQSRFPDRPVRLVVPFPPGGSYDIVARLLTRSLAEAFGQPVVIDNRPGVGGNLGADVVAKAAPDGHTLLLWGDGLLINQALFPTRPWEALRDFAPVSRIAQSPQVLIAAAGKGLDTLPALLEVARRRDVTYATAGVGTPGHLAAELLRARSGAKLVHVPYRGGAPAITDLLAGQVDTVCTGIPACLPFLQDGKVVGVGVSSAARFRALPNVPPMADAVPGVAVDTWYGVLAPARTDPAIRERIAAALATVLAEAATVTALRAQGFEPDAAGPVPFGDFLSREAPRWAELVTLSGAKVE